MDSDTKSPAEVSVFPGAVVKPGKPRSEPRPATPSPKFILKHRRQIQMDYKINKTLSENIKLCDFKSNNNIMLQITRKGFQAVPFFQSTSRTSLLTHFCYISNRFHFPKFYLPNGIWWGVNNIAPYYAICSILPFLLNTFLIALFSDTQNIRHGCANERLRHSRRIISLCKRRSKDKLSRIILNSASSTPSFGKSVTSMSVPSEKVAAAGVYFVTVQEHLIPCFKCSEVVKHLCSCCHRTAW
jgi:hypothetical protein